jgi:Tat protein translocase TatB subunit
MFGISFGEFLIIIAVAVLVIGPKDFPEIARHIIKAVAKTKQIIDKTKVELNLLGKEIGVDEIKNEVAIEMANERARIEKEITTIIDIYGNEHQVSGLDEIRQDKTKEEIELEIAEYNKMNSGPKEKV